MAASLCYGDVNWKQTSAGEFSFEDAANWDASVGSWTGTYNTRLIDLTPQLTGPQIINVGSEHTSLNGFYPGGSGGYPQIFRGSYMKITSNFRFMEGDVVLENEMESRSGENWVGAFRDVAVTIRNGGSLSLPNRKHPLQLGYRHSSVSSASGSSGTLTVAPGGTLSLGSEGSDTPQNLKIGVNSPGALWITGGTVEMTRDAELAVDGGYDGYLRLSSGVLRNGPSDFRVGKTSGCYSQFHMDGGIYVSSSDSAWFAVGSGPLIDGTVDAYITAQDVNMGSRTVWIGEVNSTSSTSSRSSLTIDEGGSMLFGNLIFGHSNTKAGNVAALNVNRGASLTLKDVSKVGAGTACINLDGGTLVVKGDLGAVTGVIYPGGGTINMYTTKSVATQFRRATGWGVSSVKLTNAGANYVVPPKVTITGGSGSGASALAVLNEDRTINRIVVTCRGEGYQSTDKLTVSFAADIGSGAAATVTLAENTPGELRIEGNYTQTANIGSGFPWNGTLALVNGYCNLGTSGTMPYVTEILLAGGLFTGRDDGSTTSPVNTSSSVVICNGMPDVSTGRHPAYRMVVPTSGKNYQSHAKLQAEDGYGYLSVNSAGAGGSAELHFDSYVRNRGLVLCDSIDTMSITIGSTTYKSASTSSTVLNGFINTATMGPLALNSSGKVVAAATTSTFGADANVIPGKGTTQHADTSVNSVVYSETKQQEQLYFTPSGQTEIRSGMVIGRKTGGDSSYLCRLASSNGSITTRVPGGLVIYENNANSRGAASDTSRRFLMDGPFADPSGGSAMPVTLAGPRQTNPSLGSLIWLLDDNNTFTGGLNLNNAGLGYSSDGSLGASGRGIHVSGFCSIRNYDAPLNIGSRALEIASDSALELNANKTDVTGTLAVNLSGAGDLIVGHPRVTDNQLKSFRDLANATFTFTGNHTAFTGTYYVASAAAGANVFSTKASLRFAGNANVPGVVRMSGSFTRTIGTGAGEVTWATPSYKSSASPYDGYRGAGGWSAVGGDLTVNLGGAGAEVSLEKADGDPLLAMMVLQDKAATGKLTFRNPVDCAGNTFDLLVAEGREATLAGTLRDTAAAGDVCLHGAGTVGFENQARVEVSTVRTTGSPVRLKKARLVPGGRGKVGTITTGTVTR